MRILILILGLLFSFQSGAQISFFYMYSNGGDDFGEGIVQLEDSSYAITGSSGSFGETGADAYLLRIDSMGNFLESFHYGGPESDGGRRVLYKQNVGYYIAGYTNSIGNGTYDYYLVKTDPAGQQLWEKAYGMEGWERMRDAALTRDTGVLMIGYTLSTPNENKDIYMVRTKSNGDTLWTKQIGEFGDDLLEAILPISDSTYYCVGSVYVEDSLQNKAIRMTIHENGTILAIDTLGAPGNTYYNDIDLLPGVEYIAVGYATGANYQGEEQLYARFNPTTGVLQTSYVGANAGDQMNRAVTHHTSDPNSCYMAVAYNDQWTIPDGYYDLSLFKYTFDFFYLNTSLQVNYPGPDEIGDMQATSDGGAIYVGTTKGDFAGTAVASKVYVCKIGPNSVYPVSNPPHVVYPIVGLEEETFNDGVSLYPNPAIDVLHISTDLNDEINVVLTDALGNIVYETKMQSSVDLDLSTISNGMYCLITSNQNGSRARKVVVQH